MNKKTPFIVNRIRPELGPAILERGEELGYKPSSGFKKSPKIYEEDIIFLGEEGSERFHGHGAFTMGFYNNPMYREYPDVVAVSLEDFFSSDKYAKENYFETKPKLVIGGYPVYYDEHSTVVIHGQPHFLVSLKGLRDELNVLKMKYGLSPELTIGHVQVTFSDLDNIIEYIEKMDKKRIEAQIN